MTHTTTKNTNNTQKLVPQLRFPEFSGAWQRKSLGNLAKISSGGTPSRNNANYWNGNIPWISTSLIDFNYIGSVDEFISEEGLVNSSAKLFPKGTILMAMYGQGKTRGKVAIMDFEAATNQACAAFLTDKSIDNKFLFQLLTRNYIKLRQLSNDGSQKNLSGNLLKTFKLEFPQLPEQQKIANFLSLVDKKILLLQQQHTALETYKKGLLQQLFSQQIRFKDNNGNDYPDWEEKKIASVLTIGSGKDYKHLEAGSVPVYGTGGIITYVNDYIYDGESVGIGRKGTIDKPIFLNEKFWTVDTLFYTHLFVDSLAKFIYYSFLTINWKQYNEASGVPSLSKRTIENIKISIPCLEEQTKIANFLTLVDKRIENVRQQIQKTQQFKKGLLQQLFV